MSSFKNSHWPLTVLGGFVSILNMLLPLVLVRILTQEEMGAYKIYFLYMSLLPWLCLTAGVGNGLSHWVGYKNIRLQATQNSWFLLLIIALVFLALSSLSHVWISERFGWSARTTHYLIIGALLSMLSNFFEDASIAWGKILRGAIFGSLFDLLRAVSMVAAAWRYRTLDAVFLAHIVVLFIKLIVGSTWGFLDGFQRPKWNRKDFFMIAKYAMPVSLAAALGVGAGWSDQVILSNFLGKESFALYSFGCLLVPPLIIFEQSVNRVLIPKLSQCFAEGKTTQAKEYFRSAVDELAWLHIPAAVGMALFAEEIVTLLYTEKYLGSAEFMRLYAINYFISHIPYDSVDRAKGRGGAILRRLTLFSVLAPISVYIGLRWGGAKGALIAALCMNAALRGLAVITIAKKEGWHMTQLFPVSGWIRYALLSVTCYLLLQIMRYALPSNLGLTSGVPWLILGGGVYAGVYMTVSLTLRNAYPK